MMGTFYVNPIQDWSFFFVGEGSGGDILERFAVIKSLDLPKIWYTNSRIMNLGSVIP